jgi:hypothetical protein
MSAMFSAARSGAALTLFLALLATPAYATPLRSHLVPSGPKLQGLAEGDEDEGESSEDILRASEEWAEARTAPADSVDAAAFVEARNAASALPVFGGSWTELTTIPYQNDDPNYRDPVWSNSFAGWRLVSGRATALAVDGDTVWAGFAAGGTTVSRCCSRAPSRWSRRSAATAVTRSSIPTTATARWSSTRTSTWR